MFTGIIEHTGVVTEISQNGDNRTFLIESPITPQLKIDQSLSHNGVCLTVEKVFGGRHQVTAIEETLQKTTLNNWQPGSVINLERSMQLNGRLDGHIVQGHVDAVGKCISISEKNGSYEFSFGIDEKFAGLIIEKGSITVNGISLTLFNITDRFFTVAIIPYTYQHTNIQFLQAGHEVNLEFDVIGKYVSRFMQQGKAVEKVSEI